MNAMLAARTASTSLFQPAPAATPGVIELRQYTLHPGRRDALIDLFERQFIESQEAAGIRLIGQFRDLDDADRFVWLRGFDDMPQRRHALETFYTGPAWRAHRDAANATMIDSDNVLLLRPFSGDRLAADASIPRDGEDARIVLCLHHFDAPVGPEWFDHFEQVQRPWLENLRAHVIATLVTEYAANTFPALPVREGEHVFVCVLRFDSEADHERCDRQLQAPWRLGDQPRRCELLRLAPTPRSRLGR